MRLLNPIYDSVFKFLMEDIEVAQGLISLIIEEDVVELIPAPQEQTTTELKIKYSQLALQRLDYVAVIKTIDEHGTSHYHKVSIEVQKSPFVPELGRFRKYVSEKYAHKSEFKTKSGVEKDYLPLKTIYFVDKAFNKSIPAVLRRKGDYWDVLNEQKYEGKKDRYVDLLTHDAWFIQIENLPPDLKNELLYALSVFAPWLRDEKNERYIEIPENDEGLKKYQLLTKIINRLQLAGKSREVETALELEVSLEKYIEQMQDDTKKARKREKQARENEKQARENEMAAMKKLAAKMKKYNEPMEEIVTETGLTEDEIEEL